MKTKRCLSSFMGLLALVASVAEASGSDIAISDVSIDRKTADDEFVILSNTGDTPFLLDGFKILQKKFSPSSASCSDTTLVPPEKFSAKQIPANGTLLIAHPSYAGSGIVDISYSKSNHLVENTSSVSLVDATDAEIARYKINTKCDPIPETPPEDPGSGTPPEPTTPVSIRLNEVFPNPEAKSDAGEFIELYNAGTGPADISGWILRDATKTGKYIMPSGTNVAAGTYFAVTDQSFKLSLNNSDETISLFDVKERLIDSMSYASSKENISLNWTPSGWRGGTPTPGMPNALNNLPMTKEKVPKKGYRGMPVAMVAKGKDADRDELKYVWDFGDGHKSYKRETSHTYEESGDYTVTLKISDGKDDVIETYPIGIRKYEAPDIRIVSFVPNPDGNDSENEWILIENREKKRAVDLLGFGIATGWKKLANHPVRESFIIEPKSEAKLTRAYSLFTLPNQKGKIELRAPDGSVIQDIKYKLEKSAPEDAVYMKRKGERWALGPAPKKAGKTPASPAVAGASTEVPEEDPVPAPTADPDPKAAPEETPPLPYVVRNDLLTADPDQPRPSDILSYGLSARLPKTVAYVPSEQVPVTPAASEPAAKETGADDVFTRINVRINAWMNGV